MEEQLFWAKYLALCKVERLRGYGAMTVVIVIIDLENLCPLVPGSAHISKVPGTNWQSLAQAVCLPIQINYHTAQVRINKVDVSDIRSVVVMHIIFESQPGQKNLSCRLLPVSNKYLPASRPGPGWLYCRLPLLSVPVDRLD